MVLGLATVKDLYKTLGLIGEIGDAVSTVVDHLHQRITELESRNIERSLDDDSEFSIEERLERLEERLDFIHESIDAITEWLGIDVVLRAAGAEVVEHED